MTKTELAASSRRGLLMGLAAAVAVPAPAIASVLSRPPAPAAAQPPMQALYAEPKAPDPIFDVIKRHRSAMKAYAKAHRRFLQHADDERRSQAFVVVGEQPERKPVVLSKDEWEFHHRWELAGKMIPLVARDRSGIEKNAPADLNEIERARWIKRKWRELRRATRAHEAEDEKTPRSRAYDAWNESSKAVERLTAELVETTPTTAAGVIAVVGHWAKVMAADGDDVDTLYALDAISTKAFLRKLSKCALPGLIAEVRS